MKRIITIIYILTLFTSGLLAQQRVIERCYVTTDKSIYVAGESILCSGFVFDVSGQKPSLTKLSSILYIELHSLSGYVSGEKMFLNNGRGASAFEIPVTIPTGNYKLVCYTSWQRNERPMPLYSKDITIYNTLSKDCIENGVEYYTEQGPFAEQSSNRDKISNDVVIYESYKSVGDVKFRLTSPLRVERKANFDIDILNSGDAASMSISVFHYDSLSGNYNNRIDNSFHHIQYDGKSEFYNKVLPDYEGEIVRGKVHYSRKDTLSRFSRAYMAFPGKQGEIYSSMVTDNGDVAFYTAGVFGGGDVAVRVNHPDTSVNATLELLSPFVKPQILSWNRLLITPSDSTALRRRSIAMQLGRKLGIDNNYTILPIPQNTLFYTPPIVYKLDDYTRFPLMEEVVREYIPELRFRKVGKRIELQVRWNDAFNDLAFSTGNTLVLVDGIPEFDHSKIFKYDPLKVKEIVIYNQTYFIGNSIHTGVVCFNTYKGDYPGFNFHSSLKIENYIGVDYPVAVTEESSARIERQSLPDLRQTIYWDPLCTIEAKSNIKIKCRAPAYNGIFNVVVEGVDINGKPFSLFRRILVD